MNIKDSYLHGGTHVVKDIQFSNPTDGTNAGKLVATITWALEGATDTVIPITIGLSSFGSLIKNTVLAAPSSLNGVPSFRVLLDADIPSLNASKITDGEFDAARLPLATNSAKGAIILGVALDATTNISGKLYWVKMNANGKIYVDVPWVNTWTAFVGASASSNGTAGYIPAPGAGNQNKFFRGDGTWQSHYFAIENLTDWADVDSNTTVSSIDFSKIYWKIAPTSSNLVYGIGIHNGLLYYIYNNKGTLSAVSYSSNTNTWRAIYANGTSIASTDTGTHAINFVNGQNTTIETQAIGTGTGLSGSATYFNVKVNAINTTYSLLIGTSTTANLVSILNGTTTTSGVIVTNSAYNASTNKIATMSDITAAVGSVFSLKGDISALPTGTQKVGYAYRVSTGFTLDATNSASGSDEVLEKGDLIICTDASTPKYLALNTNWTVTLPTSNILTTSATTIATIGGVDIKATLPIAARSGSTATTGVITPTTSGTTKFLREDGTWQVPSYTTDTVRPIYTEGTSRYGASTKTAINFVGAGATSVSFEAAGTSSGQSGSTSYGNIKISSTDEKVKFTAATTSADYYLAFKVADTTTAAQLLYYNSGVKVNGTVITATLSGNATTASNLNKGSSVRGYLYQSGDYTTSTTGRGTRNTTTIGIPYIHHTSTSNDTYVLGEDFFYKSGNNKYIGDAIYSIKFTNVKTHNSTTDDWDGSTTSGTPTGGATTYTAGTGININNGVISTTAKEWFGTEAQFNALSSLDSNTTYYITE